MGSCLAGIRPGGEATKSEGVTEASDDCVIVEPSGLKIGSVICLHGLGDKGISFKEVVMDYGGFSTDQELSGLKWIFPTAPMRNITVNRGARMNGWFDIVQFDDLQKPADDAAGIQQSVDRVKQLIRLEVDSGVPHDHIAVLGISQGGHVALKLALQAEPPLRACVILSSYLEPPNDQVKKTGGSTRFFIGHGKEDALIHVGHASLAKDNLAKSGFHSVEVREYADLEHWMCPQELRDVASFLKANLL